MACPAVGDDLQEFIDGFGVNWEASFALCALPVSGSGHFILSLIRDLGLYTINL